MNFATSPCGKRSTRDKAQSDLAATPQVRTRLIESLPHDRAQAEYAKQQYHHELLELKASQDGLIKDVATHTIGTVISPGTNFFKLAEVSQVPRTGGKRMGLRPPVIHKNIMRS